MSRGQVRGAGQTTGSVAPMYRFLWKPRWIVSHVVILGLIVSMIMLMMWQLRRLDERRDLNDRIAARADGAPAQLADVLGDERIEVVADGDRVEYRSVVVTGIFDADDEFTIPNRTLNGAPGRFVVTPLRWSTEHAPILVMRGFVPQAIDDDVAPIDEVEPPEGEVQVRGWLRESELPGSLQAEKVDLGNNRIARLDLDRIGAARGELFLPVYLQLAAQEPPTDSALLSPFPLPERSEGSHFSYAVQWGIFTLIAIVGYPLVLRRVAHGGRKGSKRGDDVPTEPDSKTVPSSRA